MKRLVLPLLLAAALAGCREEAAMRPDPVAMTAESTGHFCQMNLLEHPGPKAQVHLDGQPYPLFFSQVRDAVAYRMMPEQEGIIAATYVSDMAAAPSWEEPGAKNWIAAEDAFYVGNSRQAGGMGAPELIPFGTEAAARAFADANGGSVMRLDDIPPELALAPAGPAVDAPEGGGDDADYLARLEALATPQTPEEAKP